MSKLSFRARALDASKPMPIYLKDELLDLQDYSVLNRAVPQMPTGMEKEEESEHHLQRAISAQQVYGDAKVMVIPVPEAEISLDMYNNMYKKTFRLPKHYIHNQAQALIMEQERPDYDLDSEDEKWLRETNEKASLEFSCLQFEEMLDRLEKSCGNQLVSLQEAKLLLKEDDDLIQKVYEYWLSKRKRHNGPLLYQVRQEKRDGTSQNDSYVAFRRRTEKMQTRKNRKNDESSYEKMLKLRRELSRAVTILEMVKRREKNKRELVHLTLEVFEKRYQYRDWDGKLLRAARRDVERHRHSPPTPSSVTTPSLSKKNKSLSQSVTSSSNHKPKLPDLNNSSSLENNYASSGESAAREVIHNQHKKLKKTKRPASEWLHHKHDSSIPNNNAIPNHDASLPKPDNKLPELDNRVHENKEHKPSPSKPATSGGSIVLPTVKTTSDATLPSFDNTTDNLKQFEFPSANPEQLKSNSVLPDGVAETKKLPDGMFTFRRKENCSYQQPRDENVGDWPWMTDSKYRYSLTTLTIPQRCVGFARRRVGRGGRTLIDRAYHPYSRQIEKLDIGKEHTHLPHTESLNDLLKDIRQNRWRHFRPVENDDRLSEEPSEQQQSSKPSSSRNPSSHDDKETSSSPPEIDPLFSWNSPARSTYEFNLPRNSINVKLMQNPPHQSRSKSKNSSNKRGVSKKIGVHLDQTDMTSSVVSSFTMPITASTMTETTTNASLKGLTTASSSLKAQLPSINKSFNNSNMKNNDNHNNLAAMQQQPKCVTCGGIVTYTQTEMRTTTVMSKTTNHDNVTNCLPNNSQYQQQQPLTIPVSLSTAASSQQQQQAFHMNNNQQQQHTTVLPATVTVSTSRGGGTHTTGVPALLRINSSGTVLGGTVLYPQQSGSGAEPTSINMKKSFVAGQHKGNRPAAGNLNLNLALQSKMLASIKSEQRSSSGGSRMTHSAPSSPRTSSHHSLEHASVKPVRTSNAKTISLNFSNLVSSASYIPNSGQMISSAGGGQIAIAGNMLKLSSGGALFSVALPQMTKAPSTSGSSNTTEVASNNLVNLVASSPVVKAEKPPPPSTTTTVPVMTLKSADGPHDRTAAAVKAAVKNDVDKAADISVPMSHSVDVDSPPTTSVVDSIVVSVAKNTAPVKSSKPSRPMEVT